MGKFIDLTGMKFNRLTVVSYSHKKTYSYWNVRCDCGNELKVLGADIRSGHTKSCGCLMMELVIKHNLCKSLTYKVWSAMIQRCTNVKERHYKDYGGRGINVCNEWFKFENFYKDMGDKPEGMSLDRIDNNGNYCKENCRWATQKEQCNNQRRNVKVTYNGKTQTLTQWAEELNINSSTLSKRINRSKWTIEKSFEVKKHISKNPSNSTGFNIARGVTDYVATIQ